MSMHKVELLMNESSLFVQKASNGFVLTTIIEFGEEPTSFELKHFVVQENDELCADEYKTEENTMADLLHEIKDFFGCYYSKHKRYNVRVTVEDRDAPQATEE